MPAPTNIEEFLSVVRKSGAVDPGVLDEYLGRAAKPSSLAEFATTMVQDGILTRFQSQQFLLGRFKGFLIRGKYKLLEHLGSGGMGSVYLCEHITMGRRVAIKVLPTSKAQDPSSLERFYREARAVAALDHPNIVRAHDIDNDNNLHFLVMEYVEGNSLQEIVSRHGPMDVLRSSHYVRQAAAGLGHAGKAGLVHRDIKPANLLLDRQGVVKILDMGLARFFNEEADSLSKKYSETVLGTADYLAPEQTLGSEVDIRADIYSLGATFYFMLTGRTPFGEGTTAFKLIWHQTRIPKPIRNFRPEAPDALAHLIEKRMMAKDITRRFQTPEEVVEALGPWTTTPIAPPPEAEMPQLSRAAAMAGGRSDSGLGLSRRLGPEDVPGSPVPRKVVGVTATKTPRPGPLSPS
jgi:serine/threonine protein kinase